MFVSVLVSHIIKVIILVSHFIRSIIIYSQFSTCGVSLHGLAVIITYSFDLARGSSKTFVKNAKLQSFYHISVSNKISIYSHSLLCHLWRWLGWEGPPQCGDAPPNPHTCTQHVAHCQTVTSQASINDTFINFVIYLAGFPAKTQV